MEKLGTEAIEKELVAGELLAETIKKVVADHKLDISDIVHVVELVKHSDKLVDAAKALKDAFAEIKDVDMIEAMALLQSVSAKVHEVEKA